MADDPGYGYFLDPANPPGAALVEEEEDFQEFFLQLFDDRFPNIAPDAETIYPQLGDDKDDAKSVASEPDDNEDVLDNLPNLHDLPAPNHNEPYTLGRRTNVDLGPNDDGGTANEGRDLDPRIYTTIAPELPALQVTPHVVPIRVIASGHRPHVEARSLPIPSSQTAISYSSAYDARISQPSSWRCKDHPLLLCLTAADLKYVMSLAGIVNLLTMIDITKLQSTAKSTPVLNLIVAMPLHTLKISRGMTKRTHACTAKNGAAKNVRCANCVSRGKTTSTGT